MTLKPFQIEDLARASLQDGAIIAWEPGMGKSLAAIAWPLVKQARRVLVVAPTSLHHQMTLSAAKFFKVCLHPLRDKADFYHHRLDAPPPSNGPPRFYLVSYQALGLNDADEWHDEFGHKGQRRPNKNLVARRRLWCREHGVAYDKTAGDSIGTSRNGIECVWTPTLARVIATHNSFDCVVVDEGTRLQATESRIGASVRLLDPAYRLVLTGTPIKNRLESIFWLCAWAAGPYYRWPYSPNETSRELFADTFLQKERFLTREIEAEKRGQKRRAIVKRSNRICSIHRLWKTLTPVIIRRRKADCGEDIPHKTVTPIIVSPGAAQLAVYRYHLQNPPLRGKKPGSKPAHRRNQVGMQITNLRLAALCPNALNLAESKTAGQGPTRSWTEWTPKLAATLQIVRECLGNGKQVIIGSPFREFSQALYSKLTEAEVAAVLLDGDTSPEERGLLANEFKKGKHAVLVAGLRAMGEGHSFENCAHLILPGLSYAYDENEQFIHRVWRLTSPGPVTIYPIITEGTIDQNLHEIFTEKADASNLAIDGRLFTEPEQETDLEWLLDEAIRIFNPQTPSIEEESLMVQWDTTLARQLRHAYLQYQEHLHQANAPDAEAMEQAVSALAIPSPTQLTVDICRKHYAEGTYKKVTAATIRAAGDKIKKSLNRKPKK
jgi:hypothetical protein